MFTLNSDNDQRKNRLGVRFKCKSTLAMCLCCSLRTAPDTPRRTRCRRHSTSWTRCRRANPSPCQGRTVTARSARGCCRRMGRSKRAPLRRRSRSCGWVASADRQSAVAAYSYLSSYSYFVCYAFLLITCISEKVMKLKFVLSELFHTVPS